MPRARTTGVSASALALLAVTLTTAAEPLPCTTLDGVVRDNQSNPLPGVQAEVRLDDGRRIAASTDGEGTYSLGPFCGRRISSVFFYGADWDPLVLAGTAWVERSTLAVALARATHQPAGPDSAALLEHYRQAFAALSEHPPAQRQALIERYAMRLGTLVVAPELRAEGQRVLALYAPAAVRLAMGAAPGLDEDTSGGGGKGAGTMWAIPE